MTTILASAFVESDTEILVRESTHPTSYPVIVGFGDLIVHLPEDQAVQLESQLVHVLAGIRTDALVQS